MKKAILLFALSIICATMQAQSTEVYTPHIHTVQVTANDDYKLPAIIRLSDEEHVEIAFDHLTHNYHRFRYMLTHCNADWTPSNLSETEYLDGFNDNAIESSDISVNTTMPYTHYRLTLPNDEVRIKLSGNYRLTVYDEEEGRESPAMSTCFRVMEKQVNISAQVSSDTDIDRNKKHQQVSFTIQHKGYAIRNAQSEVKVYVLQNNRTDNEASHLKPSYVGYEQLRYEHNRALIFPAGNEYRRFETVSTRYATRGVESIRYHAPYYHVTLRPDEPRTLNYSYDQDQNGRFVIRNEEATDHHTEADYFFVHFALPWMGKPLAGDFYLQGDFAYNTFSENNRMKYNEETQAYECTKLLKQGAYNYQYAYLADKRTARDAASAGKKALAGDDSLSRSGVLSGGELLSGEPPLSEGDSPSRGTKPTGDTSLTEGNYYETENEYLILIYHRAFGDRYDRLIGMGLLQ